MNPSFLDMTATSIGPLTLADGRVTRSFNLRVESTLSTYVDDLSKALDAFVVAAGIFCSRRLGTSVWSEFTEDLEAKRAFSISPKSLWD
jgi:hypothetical protein